MCVHEPLKDTAVCAWLQAADRFNINRQWEHLQAKYVGTGHADTTKLYVPCRPSRSLRASDS